MFENYSKSLIQHFERSELRLQFQWTKINKNAKIVHFCEFLKPKACGQTVLIDRSIFIWQIQPAVLHLGLYSFLPKITLVMVLDLPHSAKNFIRHIGTINSRITQPLYRNQIVGRIFSKVKSAFYLPCLVKIAQYTLEFKSFHVTALEKREESFIKNSKV